MKKILVVLLLVFGMQSLLAQEIFTRKDSLLGGLRKERTFYDVLRYDLNVRINPEERSIVGYNDISYRVVENSSRIQMDLFENMNVDSIVQDSRKLKYRREFGAVFIDFESDLMKDSRNKLRFYYSGKPTVAVRAPWDGGFVYNKDGKGKDWVGVAVQGTGASLWFPVKDSQSDEPDYGCTIKVAVPNGLMDVSNGRLTGSEDLKDGYTRWDWEVKNPINSYDITVNIGDYVHFGESYKGVDLDYYVLRENEGKARAQFEVVKPMMDCYQGKFGAYPFVEDGFKLVETFYLGMEHQSAVSYGNKYSMGYLGRDLSNTGIGLLFDYIIVHESGHEWFGNSISSRDIADMWIHESFTCYTESVFIECQYGREKAAIYINGLKNNVANDRPIIGHYGVNNEGSVDMYYKGALMLNTIRNIINDDDNWWRIILKYCETFKHKIIDTETVIAFFNKESGVNLTAVFNQYLRTTKIPVLEMRKVKKAVEFRWKSEVADFEMPVEVSIKGKIKRIHPTGKWKALVPKLRKTSEFTVATDKFYIEVE